MPPVRNSKQIRAAQCALLKETSSRNRKHTLTNEAKFELYKEKYPKAEAIANRRPPPRSLPPTPSNKSLADKYNVDPKTVTNILDRGYDYWAKMSAMELRQKRVGHPKLPEVDQSLITWVQQMEGKGIVLSEGAIRGKANQFCDLFGIPGNERPKWSSGWIMGFKKRVGLRRLQFYGEANSVDPATFGDRLEEINEALLNFAEEDRYNFDETGLFYCMPPSVGLATEQSSGHKSSKVRISYGFCVNATGTDKRSPLIIGRAKQSRCFGKCPVSSFGYNYKWNKKAWMTGVIWLDWLKAFDRDMARQKRQVILLVDNCPAHLEPDFDLKATHLEFLPPNSTSQLQPLDAGIIRYFKAHYRRLFIDGVIARDEENSTIDPFKINQLEAMEIAQEAWGLVSSDCIRNCWKHVGLAGQFGPGLPIPPRPNDIIPQIRPAADQRRALKADQAANPDHYFLSKDARLEVEKIGMSLERDLMRLRIKDPMSIGKFLNFGEEKYIAGELSDEEVMEMTRHATSEEEEILAGVRGEELELVVVDRPLFSTKEALEVTRDMIRKIIEDADGTPEGALKMLGALRNLEKLWQRKVIQEAASQPQHSILSFFRPKSPVESVNSML